MCLKGWRNTHCTTLPAGLLTHFMSSSLFCVGSSIVLIHRAQQCDSTPFYIWALNRSLRVSPSLTQVSVQCFKVTSFLHWMTPLRSSPDKRMSGGGKELLHPRFKIPEPGTLRQPSLCRLGFARDFRAWPRGFVPLKSSYTLHRWNFCKLPSMLIRSIRFSLFFSTAR